MRDFFLFLGKFLKHGTQIASLAPSSPWLSRTTIRHIDWTRARVVVELGAGTGPITKALAQAAPASCKVLVIERDPDFAALLRTRFGSLANFEVIEADCRDLDQVLSERGIERADYVISGLPVPSFPVESQRGLFRVIRRVLAPEGSFHQITELPLIYWGLYRRYFNDVRFAFEPRNLPPAGAYYCRGIKDVP